MEKRERLRTDGRINGQAEGVREKRRVQAQISKHNVRQLQENEARQNSDPVMVRVQPTLELLPQ